TCVQTTSVWDHGLILTRVSLAVDENVKGPSGRDVEFSIPGGEIGGIRMEGGGMPVVRTGNRILVFLAKSEIGGFLVFGAIQGKFDGIRDPRDGARVVTNPLVRVTAPAASRVQSRMVADGAKRFPAVTLSDAVRSVRAWMAERSGK